MTFDVRSKTPFGPFTSPELLDLKAPPAVHTAQGRIAAWNKEHNPGLTGNHAGLARQPIKGKAGPPQYEVQNCSASHLVIWRELSSERDPAICLCGCRLCCTRFLSAQGPSTPLPISPATSVLHVMSPSSGSCYKLACLGLCRCSMSTC